MGDVILKATLMCKFNNTKKYQWRLVDMDNYVYWTGPNLSYVPGGQGKAESYAPALGVAAAENHLRKMNGQKPLASQMGFSLFFFMDDRDYGLPFRLLEAHMLVKYGIKRFADRWEYFYPDAVNLISGNPEIILRLRDQNYPDSTIPNLNDNLY